MRASVDESEGDVHFGVGVVESVSFLVTVENGNIMVHYFSRSMEISSGSKILRFVKKYYLLLAFIAFVSMR